MSRVGKLLLLLVATVFIGCRNHESPGYEFQGDENSVYYWRTELRLDSTERAFLDRHDVKKVYCRYFDVVMRDGEPMPNATISFSDTLPSGVELVPTVYITEDCMHKPHPGLAGKLVSRVRQMNETNDLPPFRELQIDCDYTARSRQVYYDFLSEIAHSPLFTSFHHHPPAPAADEGPARGLRRADALQHGRPAPLHGA